MHRQLQGALPRQSGGAHSQATILRELHFTAEQPDKPDMASVGNSLASPLPPPLADTTRKDRIGWNA